MSLTIPISEIVAESTNPLVATHPSWERVRLEEVAHVLNGYAFASKHFSRELGTPLLRIRDVGTVATECNYDGPYEARYIVSPGDLLIGMDGDFKCARWAGPPALLNQRVCKVTLRTQNYEPGLLELALPGYLNAINERTSSQTVRHLSSKSVSEIPLPLPPLGEQKRMVETAKELLARVNAARERLRRVPAILKSFRHAVLAAACSGRLTKDWREEHPDVEPASLMLERVTGPRETVAALEEDPIQRPEIPEPWAWSRCENLCDARRAITYGVIKLGAPVDGGVATLRSSDVRWLRIDEEGVKTISPPIAAAYSRTFLKGGEIVITVRGTLGGVAVVPAHLAGWNVSREVAVLPVIADLNAMFFATAIASIWSQNWLMEVTKGVAYTGVNIRDLKRLPLPVPPLEEQCEIVRRVESLFNMVDAIEGRVAAATVRAERLTQSIPAKAFRGELVLTEVELARREGRDYESAAALLERIQRERASS